MKIKPIKVKGEIMWAFLDTPSDASGKYQLDVCNLSKEAVKALEEVGVEVNHKDEKGYYVTPKSSNYPIKVFDPDGNPINVKVANGSKGVVTIKPYVNKFNKGINAGVGSVVVTDLIEYNPEAGTAGLTAL